MKKSSKPIIVITISFLLLITVIVISAQSLRLKYEELQRQLTQVEAQVKTEKTRSVSLKANFQMLTSEDAIKNYAIQYLGLVSSSEEQIVKITLTQDEISDISEQVRTTYE